MGQWKAQFRQWQAAISCGLGVFCSGMAIGWTSPNFKNWQGPNRIIDMSIDQISWVIALIQIGNACSALPIGILVNYIGRKPAILFSIPMFVISWLIIIFTRSVPAIYVARIIQGFGMGTAITVAPIYFSEVAGKEIRGMLGAVYLLGYSGGVVSEFIAGTYLSYDGLNYFSLAIPFLFFLCFFRLPESPYFLLMKKKNVEAAKSLAWLRGENSIDMVEDELKLMVESVEGSMKNKASFRDLVSTFRSRKALMIVQTAGFVTIFSGTVANVGYAANIFEIAGDSALSPDSISIVIGSIQFIAVFLNIAVIERLGRRFLLTVPVIISAISHTLTGIFFYMKVYTSVDLTDYSWIPIVLISIFFSCSAVANGGVLATIQAELFPHNTRGLASSLTTLNLTVCGFISSRLFQLITDSIGLYFNYFTFALSCLLGVCITFFFMPETKGKSYSEIQESLGRWGP